MNIVCFGDSNTWGLCCEPYRRFTREERWPALLQRRFGDRAYVIEEGLNGRTANELDEEEPFLNGRSYATACMLTHRPVDV